MTKQAAQELPFNELVNEIESLETKIAEQKALVARIEIHDCSEYEAKQFQRIKSDLLINQVKLQGYQKLYEQKLGQLKDDVISELHDQLDGTSNWFRSTVPDIINAAIQFHNALAKSYDVMNQYNNVKYELENLGVRVKNDVDTYGVVIPNAIESTIQQLLYNSYKAGEDISEYPEQYINPVMERIEREDADEADLTRKINEERDERIAAEHRRNSRPIIKNKMIREEQESKPSIQ